MEKLSKAEREFASINHNLIYYFLRKNNLNVDFYDIVVFGYLKAVKYYLKSNTEYAFSTIAFKYMKTEIYNQYSKNNAIKRKANLMHLDTVNEWISNYEINGSSLKGSSDVVKEILNNCNSEKEKNVILLLYLGYTKKQISALIKINNKRINKILRKIKTGLKQSHIKKITPNQLATNINDFYIGESFYYKEETKLIKTLPIIEMKRTKQALLLITKDFIYEIMK